MTFKAGDLPPNSYIAWHEWAEVQRKAGIKQVRCTRCGLWRTAQEMCVCTKCAEQNDGNNSKLVPIVETHENETVVRLNAENEALRAHLADAIDQIKDWGAYASEYFQKKHDLDGNVARFKAALEMTQRDPRNGKT